MKQTQKILDKASNSSPRFGSEIKGWNTEHLKAHSKTEDKFGTICLSFAVDGFSKTQMDN